MLKLKLYAGLDTDGVAKLFVIEDGQPVKITQLYWSQILKELGCQPGEMPSVNLMSEEKKATWIDPSNWTLLK